MRQIRLAERGWRGNFVLCTFSGFLLFPKGVPGNPEVRHIIFADWAGFLMFPVPGHCQSLARSYIYPQGEGYGYIMRSIRYLFQRSSFSGNSLWDRIAGRNLCGGYERYKRCPFQRSPISGNVQDDSLSLHPLVHFKYRGRGASLLATSVRKSCAPHS